MNRPLLDRALTRGSGLKKLVLILFLASSAPAQSTGTISGRIADEFGIPVSGASVIATNAAKQEFKATSAATGEYKLDQLPASAYDLTITANLMKPFSKKGVSVEPAQTVRLDASLVLAAAGNLGTLGDGDRFTQAFFSQLWKTPAPPGPTPRLPDGKPDLSGFWLTQFPDPAIPAERPEQVQPRPWADAIRKERQASQFRDDPFSRCLPQSIIPPAGSGQFVHTPTFLVILNFDNPPRQVFLDGRSHPQEANPTWLGHSIGHWEHDTLVIDTVGFNGMAWYAGGLPSTEDLHVTERYRRPDLGHLELEITVDDPAVLEKPWTHKSVAHLAPHENIEESICSENNKDPEHMVGK